MNYNLYDEDNIDLEEQMYLQDIESEMNADEDEENIEENVQEEEEYTYDISPDFLKNELKIKIESDKHHIKFTNGTNIYEGIVLSEFNKEKYIFNVKDVSSNEGYKLRTFNINKIKSI